MSLAGQKIALGVSGGIAAYRACDLVRELKKLGAEVRVSMTPEATKFVSELTFAALSEERVYSTLFSGHETEGISHIELARWCDLFVICPATANMLAKLATGFADDMLSTTLLATKAPIIVCPAMNSAMWEKEIVQSNVTKLKDLGYHFVYPEFGALATSTEGEGWGRLAAIDAIIYKVQLVLLGSEELAGRKVLVTAGPTREAIDPVRFITNYSTGRMGFALAQAAAQMGADVCLIAGPNQLAKPRVKNYIEIVSMQDLHKAILSEYDNCDVLLMSAAVADYRPKTVSRHKLKKGQGPFSIEMERNPDILSELAAIKGERVHVGFALETQNEVENARKKLESKNLDFIVLNNPLEAGAAFAGDTNIVSIINRDGDVEEWPLMSKQQVAERILRRVAGMIGMPIQKRAAV